MRAESPMALVEQLDAEDLEKVVYVQLQSLPDDIDRLTHWAEGLAIDLILNDPETDFPRLYRCAKLADNHPVRVSLPVAPGFDKGAKLAVSLGFAVNLEIGQPDGAMIDVLARVLNAYLHQSTVAEPIEPFHSLLLAFCRHESTHLWTIQEEDPAQVRYVDDQGVERLPGKLSSADPGADPAGFVEDWSAALVAAGAECAECPFFANCRGYFKWPRKDYDCAGVKTLLRTLRDAGEALRRDLAAAEERAQS